MRSSEKPEIVLLKDISLQLIQDAAHQCSIRFSSISKDLETLTGRVESEGESFLTKELPKLGKCLDKALGSSVPFPEDHSFRTGKNGYPVFLGAFWNIIFSSANDGASSERRILAVRAVRQICYLAYKLDGAHTTESEERVLREFEATDSSLPNVGDEIPLTYRTKLALENARFLLWWVFESFDPMHIVPRHGPGAVATGEKPHEKKFFKRFYEKIDEEYPYTDYFYFNYTHLCDNLESLEGMEHISTAGTAKVVLVPKDSRGPRLISMEPLEYQWIQQGLLHSLVKHLEDPKRPCFGYVNFTNQEINRNLALDASISDHLVTVDMKEASDRVSCWLVDKIFPDGLKRKLFATRTGSTLLPSGRTVTLKKFAPMGSAVCFPIEAITFWAIAVGSLIGPHLRKGMNLPEVWVYGDDIITHSENYETLKTVFTECHLMLNEDKCCTRGFFKESCGMDAFMGHPVAPIRVRHRFRPSLLAAASYCAYQNAFSDAGYDGTADFLRSFLAAEFGFLPTVCSAGDYPCLVNKRIGPVETLVGLMTRHRFRFNRFLCRHEVRLRLSAPESYESGEPDWEELLRCGIGQGGNTLPYAATETTRPCQYSVRGRIKPRWRWVDVHHVYSRARR